METKYLSDGRKVVVVGKLNSVEYIVQEIFIKDGNIEIPSGENFTTKSLHDTPVKSWKEEELLKLDKTIKERKQTIEKYNEEIKRKEKDLKITSETLKRSNFVKDKLPDFDWDYFADILTFQMKYAVSASGYIEIKELKDIFTNSREDIEKGLCGIILKTRYSDKDRRYYYHFEVSEYYEGSGNHKEYKFLKDKDELEKYLLFRMQEMYKKGYFRFDEMKRLEKYVKVPEEIKKDLSDKHNEAIMKSYNQQIDSANKTLERIIK